MKIEAYKRLTSQSTHTSQPVSTDARSEHDDKFDIAVPDSGMMIHSADRLTELKNQIFDAKRSGDVEYAKELQEELDKLLESKDKQ